MHTVHYRRWAPAQSPVSVEFPAGLLREIRTQVEQDHERGMLFGSARMAAAVGSSSARASEIRAVTARRNHETPQVAGMELVGVYICRARGEVFLTDDDLAYMDQHQAPIALVVAGVRAGFFVRNPNGTIQAVRSYEEFAVADAAPLTERLARNPAQPPVPEPSAKLPWKAGLLMLAVLAIPVGAVAYLRPMLRDLPISIALREDGEQLVASWDPSVAQQGGRLEITDAGIRTTIEVAPGSTGAVYQRHAASQIGNQAFQETISVRLNAGRRTGIAQWSAPYLASPTARPAVQPSTEFNAPGINATSDQVAELEREVRKLRMVEANRNAQIVDLSKLTERILNPRQAPTSAASLASWYRDSVNAKPAQ